MNLEAAVRAELPHRIEPQLATLAAGLPASGDWRFEIKLDGYRLMTRIDRGRPALITRGGHDWTGRMETLAAELSALQIGSAWLDGEIVVLDERGLPQFNALQNAFDRGTGEQAIVYFVFDLPYFEGHDLRAVPLRERRALLERVLREKGAGARQVRFSADFAADPSALLESARQLQLEGVIAKRADAPYVSARTDTWLKLKVRQRQEFVVGGYTDRGDDPAAPEIGSLLLGVYRENGAKGPADGLVSVGSVGTGWDGKTAAELKQRLLKMRSDASPFAADAPPKKGRWSRRAAGAEHWVKPQVVVEVSFTEWTPEGQIRHATYEGVREDKPAREVRREVAAVPAGGMRAAAGSGATAVKVSNPERVIDPGTGLTKLDLVRYYESVAGWLLPHLKGRPCSLVRGPSGIGGELFFQKHADKLRIPDVRDLDPALWPGHDALLEVPTAKAISGAAQMNVIEFHTWNARADRIDKPDRVVFDLDPGEGVAWKQLQEAALLVRSLLRDVGLESWLKTSGGKGLHVVVPLAPREGWATVKAFSQALVQHLAHVVPSRFVAKSGASNRVGKIFVDYLRNSHGATTAAAYSARARPGLGVSMPIEWDALPDVKGGDHWTVATAREHLSFQTSDPWADYFKSKQTLAKAKSLLTFEAAGGE